MNRTTVELKQLCNVLLDENSSWADRKNCLVAMHTVFVALGALNLQDDSMRSESVPVQGGTAIAPTWAGMCLFDVARTRKFVLGLREAISDKIADKPQQPVQVLDAGCGPYGLLSLLVACYFTSEEVQFTLLDIFPENVESTQKLINNLQLSSHFSKIVVADALSYSWPADKDLDILVTETMNTALWKEPQVAITLHLVKQLSTGGILIPEIIEVSIGMQQKFFTGSDSESIQKQEDMLCTLLKLDKFSKEEDVSRRPLATVQLPVGFCLDTDKLQFFTRIKIYKQWQLASNESAITLPKKVTINQEHLSRQEAVSFYYEMDAEPGFRQML